MWTSRCGHHDVDDDASRRGTAPSGAGSGQAVHVRLEIAHAEAGEALDLNLLQPSRGDQALHRPDRYPEQLGGFSADIDAEFVRGFAEASSRRELKPILARLYATEDLVTRQLVDDVLKYKRLDGADAALRTLQGTLLTDGGAGSSQARARAG